MVVGAFGFIAVIGILAAIAIPNFISYRSRAACMNVENEAQMASAAINDYFLENDTETVPTLEELSQATGYTPSQRVSIDIQGEKDQVIIMAADMLSQCKKGSVFFVSVPEDNSVDGWK